MASEEQEMLLKISQLAGQINRHKNGQPADQQSHYVAPTNYRGSMQPLIDDNKRATDWNKDYAQGYRGSRGGYASRGYGRGGRPPPVHRNRTLVLNGATPTTANQTENVPPTSGSIEPSNGLAFVAKTGRHLQLINTSIYEKDSQTRAKAMEETRKQKMKQRDDREKAKFHNHIQRLADAGGLVGSAAQPANNHEIVVQGIRFRVTNGGGKLAKVSEDYNAAKSTPKITMIGGVRFHRTKNGNMYRAGIIKAHRYGRPHINIGRAANARLDHTDPSTYRRIGTVKKINEPCKVFSTTGSCAKGPRCRYIHDPAKVAVCKDFLQKGACPSGDKCDLSHDLTPQRSPACLHFAKGNCSNAKCQYTHLRVSPSAPVCRAFGIYGYCEKGAECEDRHIHECPDFSNTGKCTTKGCKLPHRHKAHVMRINVEDENSDISSEEDDEEIDSDDVDSDDLEIFGDDAATEDSDIPRQRDYVQFS